MSTQPGHEHCVPLEPCPLCHGAAQFRLYEDEAVYTAECTQCGLTLGLPNGYSSRLDLANDWNNRNATPWQPIETIPERDVWIAFPGCAVYALWITNPEPLGIDHPAYFGYMPKVGHMELSTKYALGWMDLPELPKEKVK